MRRSRVRFQVEAIRENNFPKYVLVRGVVLLNEFRCSGTPDSTNSPGNSLVRERVIGVII